MPRTVGSTVVGQPVGSYQGQGGDSADIRVD